MAAKSGCTGACTINRTCAQQYVGKSQSCMVISGRLIVHACAAESVVRCKVTEDEPDTQEQPAMWSIDTAYAKALPWKAAADKSMGGSENKKPLPPIQRLPRYEAETPAEALELGECAHHICR